MCSSVSSTGNDLGVWYFSRDGCWTCLSVHLYYPQFASGNEEVLFFGVSSTFINNRQKSMIMFMDSFIVQKWFYNKVLC